MGMKHTPGPWTYHKSEGSWGKFFYIAQQEGAPYTPHFSDVAQFNFTTCSGEHLHIQEANARLIAAAPELLEALRIAANSAGFQYMTYETREAINLAIAKATGEQP